MFRAMMLSVRVNTAMCYSKMMRWKVSCPSQQIDAVLASAEEHQLFRDRRT